MKTTFTQDEFYSVLNSVTDHLKGIDDILPNNFLKGSMINLSDDKQEIKISFTTTELPYFMLHYLVNFARLHGYNGTLTVSGLINFKINFILRKK